MVEENFNFKCLCQNSQENFKAQKVAQIHLLEMLTKKTLKNLAGHKVKLGPNVDLESDDTTLACLHGIKGLSYDVT